MVIIFWTNLIECLKFSLYIPWQCTIAHAKFRKYCPRSWNNFFIFTHYLTIYLWAHDSWIEILFLLVRWKWKKLKLFLKMSFWVQYKGILPIVNTSSESIRKWISLVIVSTNMKSIHEKFLVFLIEIEGSKWMKNIPVL